MKDSEQGLQHLRQAVDLTTPENMDAYFDLFVVYRELGRHQEAESVLDRGEQMMPGFRMRVGAPRGGFGVSP
jgi:hypothetical protein